MAIAFGPDVLELDEEAEVARISEMIRGYLQRNKRKGAIVAVSGGIDSSVVAALCVRALGARAGVRAAHARAGVG